MILLMFKNVIKMFIHYKHNQNWTTILTFLTQPCGVWNKCQLFDRQNARCKYRYKKKKKDRTTSVGSASIGYKSYRHNKANLQFDTCPVEYASINIPMKELPVQTAKRFWRSYANWARIRSVRRTSYRRLFLATAFKTQLIFKSNTFMSHTY